jgi:hypothetical protein
MAAVPLLGLTPKSTYSLWLNGSTANTKSDGTGTIGTDMMLAHTAGANGAWIDRIRFMPVGVTATTTAVNEITVIDEDFDMFWDLYDYKKSRDKAEKVWKTLNKEEKALALQHAPVYAQSTPDKQFRKHPTTYLNSKSFNDEIIERTISTKLSYAELEWERLKNLG